MKKGVATEDIPFITVSVLTITLYVMQKKVISDSTSRNNLIVNSTQTFIGRYTAYMDRRNGGQLYMPLNFTATRNSHQ